MYKYYLCSLSFSFPPSRPVHYDRSLHIHRPLPQRRERVIRPLLHPGLDLLRYHLHILNRLLCSTQENCKLVPRPPAPSPHTNSKSSKTTHTEKKKEIHFTCVSKVTKMGHRNAIENECLTLEMHVLDILWPHDIYFAPNRSV